MSDQKEQEPQYENMFETASNITELLGYFAGYSSMCWKETPTSEFDSVQADIGYNHAQIRLTELLREQGFDFRVENLTGERAVDSVRVIDTTKGN